ncbi:hypothetical protein [Paenibacillus sp. Marseille-Q9583]
MNQKRLFNEGWEFAKSTLEVTNAESLDFHPVDLPHDWLIYNTLDLYENSVGWYRCRWILRRKVLSSLTINEKRPSQKP